MTSTFYERLSGDFEKIFEDSEKYDVVIEVGEFPMNQSYAAHSIILRHRCPSLYKELNEIALDTNDLAQKIIAPQLPVSSIILPARNLTISELPTREVAEKSSVIIHGHTARGLTISKIPVQAVSGTSSVATYEYAARGLTISEFPRAIKNLYNRQGGPTFGLVDLVLEGNFRTARSGYCLRYDYEKPIRSVTTRFSVKEYEVFQIGPRT
ncbi:13422_t:CDS:2 [Acaulospora morrowiae]|uniref:13422_t:CDS:1 n=1 Tax=Acaulospora morrowiae TaxID=94023 RepID=A0A9N9AJW2_9GLOM|nr:13422_t:CDS:2 [Acaulospora morrowiae]